MAKFIAWATAVLCWAAVLPSGVVSAEALSAAVERAVLNHPEIRALKSTRLAARSAIEGSKSLVRPRIALSASGGAYQNDSDVSDTFAVSLTASQPLYDGGAAKSERRRTKAEAGAAGRRLADAANVIALQAVQAYFEVQRSKEIRKIVERNLARLEDIERRVAMRTREGFGSEADIYEASAKVEAARLQVAEARLQAKDAAAVFQLIVGRPPGKLSPVSAPGGALPTSVDEAVRLGRKQSPKIMAVQYDALAAFAAIAAYEASSKPKVDLAVGLNYRNDVDHTLGESQDLSALLNFRLDLYDGGAAAARTAQARHVADASRLAVEAAALDVEREIRLSWNVIVSAQDRLGPLKRQQRDARRALELNLSRFDAGLVTLEKILDLQSFAAAAEVAHLNQIYAGRYNVFRILGGTGRLLPALGIRLAFLDERQ
jgi:outer membrane protein, adhesin transport system